MTTTAEKFRLPETTTEENLEERFSKTLTFGTKVLIAGYFYNGLNQPNYYAAVYEHTDEDLTCEGRIALKEISEDFFEDDGHAIAWALTR